MEYERKCQHKMMEGDGSRPKQVEEGMRYNKQTTKQENG